MKRKCVRILLTFTAGLLLVSCSKDSSVGPSSGNPPAGFARISGLVRDTANHPLAGVNMHVIYELASLLPAPFHVELSYLSAGASDSTVQIQWTTISEAQNDHFEILRDDTSIAVIPSQGNGPSGHSYTYVDRFAINPNIATFYTLRAVGPNGQAGRLCTALASQQPVPCNPFDVVTEYALPQNYPNPFETSTTIVFDLVDAGVVTLLLHDASGNSSAIVVPSEISSGRHNVLFDSAGLANGLYTCRLTVGDVYADSVKILKNATADTTLAHTNPLGTSGSNGRFQLDVAVGDTDQVRDEQNYCFGYSVLRRLTIVAMKDGYQTVRQTLDASGGQSITLNIVMPPQ